MNGLLIVISSPSGGGKTTIIKSILKQSSNKYAYSISATTREIRSGEIDKKDYFFLSIDQFKEEIKNDRFLEWEEVHGYYYGTPKENIEKLIKDKKKVFLDIDVNGASQVINRYPGKTVSIFVVPPSAEELIKRLKNRKTDSDAEINKRLKRFKMEMGKSDLFDHIVVNDKLDVSIKKVQNIIDSIE